MSKLKWFWLFILLPGIPYALATDPRANQNRPTLEHAMAAMQPLQIGKTTTSSTSKNLGRVRFLELNLYDIPILNFQVKVVEDASGKSIAHDQYSLPSIIPTPVPRITEKEIALHLRKQYPTNYVKNPVLGYIGERDSGRFNRLNQTIKRLRLVWSFGLSNLSIDSVLGPSRFLVMDAHSGEIIQDHLAYQQVKPTPEPFYGFGYHSGMVKLDGSQSTSNLSAFCMRDPSIDYPEGAFSIAQPACERLTNSTFGISAYRYHLIDGEDRFAPIKGLRQQPTMGDGTAMDSVIDTDGEESLAVDMYYYAQKAIAFYLNNFGRTHIGSIEGEDRLALVPYLTIPNSWGDNGYNNAVALGGSSAIIVRRTTDPINLSTHTNEQFIMHEYTHLVMHDQFRPVISEPEYRAINEGIADIFAVLFKASLSKDQNTLPIVDASEWIFGDLSLPTVNPQLRYLDLPSRDRKSVDHYPATQDEIDAFNTLDEHYQGGVIRRWFYALANGLEPYTPPFNDANSSKFLKEGMQGIGVRRAAEVLYETISLNHTPGYGPGYAMFQALTLPDQCNDTYKAISDAWRAVGMGTGADRSAPIIQGTLARISPTYYQISVRVTEQSAGFQLIAQNPILLNVRNQGVDVGTIQLALISDLNGEYLYTGSATFPVSALSSTTNASAELQLTDLTCRLSSDEELVEDSTRGWV